MAADLCSRWKESLSLRWNRRSPRRWPRDTSLISARAYEPTVGGLSSHFVWLNRSKQSLTLDVKAAEARAVLGRLLTRADVFVQNLAPSAAERVSLGTGELRQKYPRLIVCNLSGY